MSERSARQGKRSEPSPKQTTRSTSRRGVTSTRSTNSASTGSTDSASTRSTAGSTSGPSRRNKRTSFSASGESTSTPAAKRRWGTESLTRNDIPDIVAAVLQAVPNSNTTANSPAAGTSQNQPSHSVDAANPTIQAVSSNRSGDAVNPTRQAVVLPDEELHHQEVWISSQSLSRLYNNKILPAST